MEIKFVSFDIADQTFKFYTALEWHNLLADCRKEHLAQESDEDFGDDWLMSVDELLEYFYGDEFLWDELPK